MDSTVYQENGGFKYDNRIKKIKAPSPLLKGNQSMISTVYNSEERYEGNPLIYNKGADIVVRAWRYSHRVRGIIELNNYIDSEKTAVIIVHPWGVDDDNLLNTSEPCGATFMGTPEKNALYHKHLKEVVLPFIDKMRDSIDEILYSLPGEEDEIRKLFYHSVSTPSGKLDRKKGQIEYEKLLKKYSFSGNQLPDSFQLNGDSLTRSYFKNFSGIGADEFYDGDFWKVPLLLASDISYKGTDKVIYDGEGYEIVKSYLKEKGIENILLCGYATDACVVSTTAGYENLEKDFNVFVVGDCTLATFPAVNSAGEFTSVALCKASISHFITETAWIQKLK